MVFPSSSSSDLSLAFDLKPLSQHSIFFFWKRCSFFSTFMNSSSLFLQCLFVFPALIRFCFITTTLLIHESKGKQIGMSSANLCWAGPWFWSAGESAETNRASPSMASYPPGDLLGFFHGICVSLRAIRQVAPTCKRFSISVFVTFNIVLLAKVNHLANLTVCVRVEYQRVWMQGGMNNLHKPLT